MWLRRDLARFGGWEGHICFDFSNFLAHFLILNAEFFLIIEYKKIRFTRNKLTFRHPIKFRQWVKLCDKDKNQDSTIYSSIYNLSTKRMQFDKWKTKYILNSKVLGHFMIIIFLCKAKNVICILEKVYLPVSIHIS